MHSAIVPDEAAKTSGNASTAVVTYSIIVSRIIYALPAWGGFLSVQLKIIELILFSSASSNLVT